MTINNSNNDKEQKAKEYIDRIYREKSHPGMDGITMVTATANITKVVKIVESELYTEEECIEAFCKACKQQSGIKCEMLCNGCKFFISALKALK